MAHKGRIFPILQEWRLYSGEAGTLNGFPPAVMRFRTSHWVATFAAPPVNVWFEADPLPWSPGDLSIGYQSAVINTGSPAVRVGAIGRVEADHQMNWKYAIWADGVDQIPWGWHDQPQYFPWFPGDVKIIPSSPGAGGSIFPVGVVEVSAKNWP